MQATINNDQRLFVIPEGKGYSCLGFDVCHKRACALAKELGEPIPGQEVGSLESLAEYNRLVNIAREPDGKLISAQSGKGAA